MSNIQVSKVRGKDYLDAANTARLFWEMYKDKRYRVETEIVSVDSEMAVVRATITVYTEDGEIEFMANGTKQTWREEFGSYIEKSESGAIRRAMSLLGVSVGSIENDEAPGAPQRFANRNMGNNTQGRPQNKQEPTDFRSGAAPKDQCDDIARLFREQKFTMGQVAKVLKQYEVSAINDLSKGQASNLQLKLQEGSVKIPE